MDQGQIIEKPENHTRELKLYFACDKECSGSFTLRCEKVNIKICKILFTQSISGAQIFQVKPHTTVRKGVQSPGPRAHYQEGGK